jgi:hypothetical protein
MASYEFNARFKNKSNRIGKNGLISLNSFKAIEKSLIPENKLHTPITKWPTPLKLIISQKILESSNKTPEPFYSSAANSSIKMLPRINVSPLKTENTRLSRSKSPLESIYNDTYNDQTAKDITKSCFKLPHISSGIKILRSNIKKNV